MTTPRLTTHVPNPTRALARTSWSILDPTTQQCRVVRPEEYFPIAGRLLSGVWQLDDGRVLLATSVDDEVKDDFDQATVRIEYLDHDAAIVTRASNVHHLTPKLAAPPSAPGVTSTNAMSVR